MGMDLNREESIAFLVLFCILLLAFWFFICCLFFSMRLASHEEYLLHFQISTPYRSVEQVSFLIHFSFILMLDPKRECVEQAK